MNMELDQACVKDSHDLYFVEGFDDEHFIVRMKPLVKEVKIGKLLLHTIRRSHDEQIDLKSAYEYFVKADNEGEWMKIRNQVQWLTEKGVIQCI